MFDREEFLKLKESWELLRETKLPIFIYGMGDGCLKILNAFEKFGIKCSGIFASDEFVRGHSFEGFKVKKLSEVEEENGEFLIVCAFAAGYKELIEKIDKINARHKVVFPDTEAVGTEAFTKSLFMENFDSFKEVYELLEDDFSKSVFENVMKYKITGDIHYLKLVTTFEDEVYENIYSLDADEVYVDLGAYNGDTVKDFLNRTNSMYRKIYAFEPNVKNFKKLCAFTEGMENVYPINAAAWSENTEIMFTKGPGRMSKKSDKAGVKVEAKSVDSVLNGDRCTYIKFDVEGAEEEAINGAENTIKTYSPKLCIALYHKNLDMFKIPLMIKTINPSYKLYVRHFPYYPAWETNLFAKI